MKRKYWLAGSVIFCVLAVLAIYRLRHGSPVFVVGAPPPQVSSTPCIIKDVGTNPPPNVCDQCGNHFTHRIPQQQPNGRDVVCCPDGMTFGETPGTCVKP